MQGLYFYLDFFMAFFFYDLNPSRPPIQEYIGVVCADIENFQLNSCFIVVMGLRAIDLNRKAEIV